MVFVTILGFDIRNHADFGAIWSIGIFYAIADITVIHDPRSDRDNLFQTIIDRDLTDPDGTILIINP
jgi:hypothetical protein